MTESDPHRGFPQQAPAVDVVDVSRRFGPLLALDCVSLSVRTGGIHALLGPNGAGKTTLLRILVGLVRPTSGSVRVAGLDPTNSPLTVRRAVGFVPASDRSFYLRISGLENLIFFARLHGMKRRAATEKARETLGLVGLEESRDVPAGRYSHGMQKRLAIARALLAEPAVLLVDEATHDLDPLGARATRDTIAELAGRGTTVLWATQRLDEIRGFADGVTLIDRGQVRFAGTVPELTALAVSRRYLLQLRNGVSQIAELEEAAAKSVAGRGTLVRADERGFDHFVLSLDEGAPLGDALQSLTHAGIEIVSCTAERSDIEEAFLNLTAREGEKLP